MNKSINKYIYKYTFFPIQSTSHPFWLCSELCAVGLRSSTDNMVNPLTSAIIFFFLCVDLVTLHYTAYSGLCYADCSKWVCCWCYELGTNISNWVASVLERGVCVWFVLSFIIRNFSMAILRFGFCFLLTACFHHQHLFMFLTFQMASYPCSEIAANGVGLVRR